MQSALCYGCCGGGSGEEFIFHVNNSFIFVLCLYINIFLFVSVKNKKQQYDEEYDGDLF